MKHNLPTVQVYLPQPRYRIFALVSLIAAGYTSWESARNPNVIALFFLLVCLGIAGWNLHSAFSLVAVGSDRLILKRPLQPDQTVEFRQLMSASGEGRASRSILLMYHPQNKGDAMLKLEDVRALYLPAVNDQEELLTHLTKQVPV